MKDQQSFFFSVRSCTGFCLFADPAFLDRVEDGSAKRAFYKDLDLTRSLGIHSLPAYLLQCGEHSLLIKSLIGYEDFVQLIEKVRETVDRQ